MYRVVSSLAAALAVLCMLHGCADAQATNSSCFVAQNMINLNLTQFNGTWWEVARAPSAPWNCVEAVVSNTSDTVSINVTVATNPNMLNLNISMIGSFPMNPTSPNSNAYGYNITYNAQNVVKGPVTLKIITTDYQNYALICGYTNASDSSTVFEAVLTRNRTPTVAQIQQWETMAPSNYSDFSKNMTMVTQSDVCYRANGASTTVPALVTIFAALYAALKAFN